MLDPAVRIAELEDDLRQRDDKIKELARERDEALELVDRSREQQEDTVRLIENWAETFEMPLGDNGNWVWDPAQSELWEKHAALWTRYQSLVRRWNKFVPEYNSAVSPRERGRPLAASESQCADVLKRRKAGESLRAIGSATALSLRTVRTIVGQSTRKGRSKRTNELRRQEFDRRRAAAYRARKKARARLPEQIAEAQQAGVALIKAAKGLGR
jgi:hypothetical protein